MLLLQHGKQPLIFWEGGNGYFFSKIRTVGAYQEDVGKTN